MKIYGDNLDAIQRKAFEIEKLINEVPGAAGVSPSRVQGKPYLNIEVDRVAMARYGLSAKDVLDAVEISIGGKNVSTTIEGRQRFPIQIRVERGERDDIEKLSRILIAAKPGMSAAAAPQAWRRNGWRHGRRCRTRCDAGRRRGADTPYIPLGMVAKITRSIGANEIASENGKLRSYVQANVQDRDLGGFVEEIEQKLKTVNWEGMTYKMTGEYENQRRFTKTMWLIFPLVMMVIFVLLFMVFHSGMEAAHVMLAVPFALSGGVLLQKFLGYNFNGAVWVGYIALFGTAVQTGVVMVVYLEETVKTEHGETGRGLYPGRSRPGGQRRRQTPPAPEGDDRGHHRRQPAAHHVEQPPGRGNHETAGHAGHRRDDLQPDPHPHRHPGDFPLAARTPAQKRHAPSITLHRTIQP